MIRGQIAADDVYSERMPENIKKVRTLKKYLCSMAYPKDFTYHKGTEEEPDVNMCRICVSQCGYGRRLIELMGG